MCDFAVERAIDVGTRRDGQRSWQALLSPHSFTRPELGMRMLGEYNGSKSYNSSLHSGESSYMASAAVVNEDGKRR